MQGEKLSYSASDLLKSRFCYWQGNCGTRYLFSQIPLDEIPSFSDCILLLAIEDDFTGPALHWIGEISDLKSKSCLDPSEQQLGNMIAYVHLLAGSRNERSDIVCDLMDDPDKSQWHLCA